MSKKLRQVTDSIHGTIYLSNLESELISTPYFYRLHDIYQSSTVYMTFPSNRTKRYEHSLGTMKLASQLLFSSVTNADSSTREILFKKLKEYFERIVEFVFDGGDCEKLYFNKSTNIIAALFDEINNKNQVDAVEFVRKAVKDGEFNDTALNYYQYYPTECITEEDSNSIENVFLYRCLLQAVRIIALFHDVGHPPYSHIIEEVLKDLYKSVGNDSTTNWIDSKVRQFRKCLKPFLTEKGSEAFCCNRLLTKSSFIEAAPHERVGLGLLSYAIDDVVPEKISVISQNSKEAYAKLTHILYYIVVVEFAFAILAEEDMVFKSFHKIVDGIVDADRLDYIVRDSQNSGVDWGKIPYERIINSAKLFYMEKDNSGTQLDEQNKSFIIAYPKKISDDIEDLLLIRYKIFARINFHHRCMKTSMALQAAVRYLAIDYLTNDDKNCINSDICILWMALNTNMGDKRIRVIQWNDSWLISALHKSLVYLHTNRKNMSTDKKLLKENLEEFLLNKKKYISLIKRGNDNCRFVNLILNKAGITTDKIQHLKNEEYKKYYINQGEKVDGKNILSNPKSEAIDSIGRLSDVFDKLDLELLCNLIPLDGNNLKKVIEESLRKCKKITNFAVIINYDRGKTGLPKHTDILDAIYLYESTEYKLFDEFFSLSKQIWSIEKNVPWLYVYFVPKVENDNIKELSNDLIESLATDVAERLRKRYDELFPGKAVF